MSLRGFSLRASLPWRILALLAALLALLLMAGTARGSLALIGQALLLV